MVHGIKPDLADLPEWGTKLFVLKENQGKLDPRADEGRWMGYSDESKGHRVYWSGRCRVTIKRNITFDMSIPTAPGDTQAEGEPATQVAQNNAHVPQPQTSAIDPMRADPPEGLETTDQSQGRGH